MDIVSVSKTVACAENASGGSSPSASSKADNVTLFSGEQAFELVDSFGYPFECLIDDLADNNAVLDVRGFIRAAVKAGWSNKTINQKFESAKQDCITKKNVYIIFEKEQDEQQFNNG